jgi:hypothetical protein
MAIRGALMKAYAQEGVHSFEQAWEVLKAGGSEGGKGAILGGLTFGAGQVARVGVAAAGGGAVARTAGAVAAEASTLATAGAALNGHMPTSSDFLDAAILVGGLRAATGVAGGLRDVYAKTGVTPSDAALAANADPTIKADLLKGEFPAALKPIAAMENAKAAVPLDEVGAPLKSNIGPDPFKVGADTLGQKIPVPRIDPSVIESYDNLQGAVSKLEEVYKGEIDKQTRSPVSNKQSYIEAQRLLADTLGVLPDRLPGDAITTPSVLARAAMADALAKDLVNTAKEVQALGPEAGEARIAEVMAKAERAGMGAAYFRGERAEAGRTLQILNTVKNTTAQLELIRQAVEQYGGKADVTAFIDALGKADRSAAELKMASRFTKPTLLDKTIEAWKMGALSGPATHIANVIGNTVGLFMQTAESYAGAAIGKAVSNPERIRFEEGTARLNGIVQAIPDALLLAKEGMMGRLASTGKLEQQQPANTGKIADAARFITFNQLTAQDVFFRTLAERAEGRALATRQALSEGLNPDTVEFQRRATELVQNADDSMLTAMKKAGDEATYTKELGKMGKHLNLMVQGSPLEFILPYRKTPINLFKEAAKRFPGVNFLMKEVRDDLAAGGTRRDMVFARMVTGSVVLGITTAAISNGTLTGGGFDKTPEQKATARAAGWQPYSWKFNGKWHSYSRFAPMSNLMMAMADAIEISNAAEGDSKKEVLPVAIAAIGNATISQTYLSGLGSMVGALTDPQRYGERWVEQLAGSVVPAIAGQTAAAIDPKEREVNGVFEAIQARIPLWREKLLPAKNPLTGEDAKSGRNLLPVKTSKISDDKVLTEAVRLGVGISAAPKDIHVGRGTGKIGNVEISPESRNAFTQEQGRFAHDILSPIVTGPMWDSIPDIAKVKVYDRVMASARKNAALVALPPEQRIAAAIKISDEISAKVFGEVK